MPQFEGEFGSISATVQGLVVSSILITGSLASVFSGHLSDRISRTRTLSLGAAIFCVGSIISSASQNLAMLFVGRFVAGAGEGVFLSAVTVYILEIAPTSIRGRLSCVNQLLITIGITSGELTAFNQHNVTERECIRRIFCLLREYKHLLLACLASSLHSTVHRIHCVRPRLALPSAFASMAPTCWTDPRRRPSMAQARVHRHRGRKRARSGRT